MLKLYIKISSMEHW